MREKNRGDVTALSSLVDPPHPTPLHQELQEPERCQVLVLVPVRGCFSSSWCTEARQYHGTEGAGCCHQPSHPSPTAWSSISQVLGWKIPPCPEELGVTRPLG